MKRIFNSLSLVSVLALGACSLPNTGPTVSAMSNTTGVSVIDVTPALVQQMSLAAKTASEKRKDDAIQAISAISSTGDHVLSPGDSVSIKLWTFSPFPGASASGDSSSSGSGGLNEAPLGTFEIATDGTVELPYARKVRISGLTMQQAQAAISNRYTGLGILQRPAVSVTPPGAGGASSNGPVNEGDADGIIVTGTVGNPRILPWNSGGMTTARALTLALGSAGSNMESHDGNESSNGSHPAISVDVSRNGHKLASLPMDVALEQDIPLQPRDHLIVTRRPAVHATVIGGGAKKVGNYGFSDTPTLAEVIAEGQGLDAATADDTAIFVYRTQPNADGSLTPRLYRLAWNRGASIMSAQNFPIEDHDVVVIGEAGIVPVTRVLSLIFQMGVMASIAK